MDKRVLNDETDYYIAWFTQVRHMQARAAAYDGHIQRIADLEAQNAALMEEKQAALDLAHKFEVMTDKAMADRARLKSLVREAERLTDIENPANADLYNAALARRGLQIAFKARALLTDLDVKGEAE
jgi:hypothetical protein